MLCSEIKSAAFGLKGVKRRLSYHAKKGMFCTTNRPFRVLTFKTKLKQYLSCENEFYLHENKKIIFHINVHFV